MTQIVTQVCAKACGYSGQSAAKSRTFRWRNGRIVLKITKNHEPIAAGSHEVSGSIPLISTRKVLKSHDFRTFSLTSSANNQPHFFSHATRPRFDPNGRKRSGFIEIYLTKQHEYFLNDINQIPVSGGQFMPTCGVLLWIFPWFSVILSEKTRMQRKPGVFPLARYQSCRMEFPDGSESGEIIVYRHRF